MSDFTEKKVGGVRLYDGKILNLRRDDVLLPNGRTSKREVVEHNGGSSVVVVKDGKILLVRQYRYAVGETLYEIPAGKLEKGEDPKAAALRELGEEGGIEAGDAELWYMFYPTPAYTEEKIYVYSVGDFTEGEMHLDENEFLEGEWVDLKQALEMTKDGRIRDAKTIIAVQRLALDKKI